MQTDFQIERTHHEAALIAFEQPRETFYFPGCFVVSPTLADNTKTLP